MYNTKTAKIDNDKIDSLNQKLRPMGLSLVRDCNSDFGLQSVFHAELHFQPEDLTRDRLVQMCREAKRRIDDAIDQYSYVLLKELF